MIPFYASQLNQIASDRYSAAYPGTTYGRIDPESAFAKHFLTEPIMGDDPDNEFGLQKQTGSRNLPFGVFPGKFLPETMNMDRDLTYGLRPDGTITNAYGYTAGPEGTDAPFPSMFTTANVGTDSEGSPGVPNPNRGATVLEDELVRRGFDPKSVNRRQDKFDFDGIQFTNPHSDSYMGSKAPTVGDYVPGIAFSAAANWTTGGWYGYAKGASDLLDDGGSGKSRAEKGRIIGGMAAGGIMDAYNGADVSDSGMDFGGAGVGWNPNGFTGGMPALDSIASDPSLISNSGMDFGGSGVGWSPSQQTGAAMSNPGWLDNLPDLPEWFRKGGTLDDWMKKYGISKGGPLSTLWNLGTGGYGIYKSRQMQKDAEDAARRADPFTGQRADAQARMQYLTSNPNAVGDLPGYKAGLDAVERKMASQGYNNSGNMSTALLKYGGDAYNQELARLGQLATTSPGNAGSVIMQGRTNSIDLLGRSLNNIAYGIGGR